MSTDHDKYATINFEETELRLGLPGPANEVEIAKISNGKRGFSETLVDLKLNLSTKESTLKDVGEEKMKEKATALSSSADPAKPPSKYVFFSKVFAFITFIFFRTLFLCCV